MNKTLIILMMLSGLSPLSFANTPIYDRNITPHFFLADTLKEVCGNNMLCKKNLVRVALDTYWGQMIMERKMDCGTREVASEAHKIVAERFNIPLKDVPAWIRGQYMLKEEEKLLTNDLYFEIKTQIREQLREHIVLSALKKIEFRDRSIFPVCGEESFSKN